MSKIWQFWMVALLVACGGDSGEEGVGAASQDTGADASDLGSSDADAAADTAVESDGATGSGADAVDDTAVAPDTTADVSNDTAADPDTTADVAEDTTADSGDTSAPLRLTSAVMADGGTMPARHTCDDLGVSPPLAWDGVPDGTGAFALLATTIAPDGKKWNWVLYNLPASQRELAEGQTDAGTFGRTSDGPALAYAAPCSQGPGEKFYTFTLYALDAPLTFAGAPSTVTGDLVEAAIAGHVLAESAFSVGYTRPVP
jgi:phosphatidylethanolamine-binding protein (PEBP) family uncharacterized protein